MEESPERDCLHWQAGMESPPAGRTLRTCEQKEGRRGLLRALDPGLGAATHVCDLFHEDAQVG